MEIAWRRWETQMKKRSRLWLGLLAAGLGAAVAAAQTFVESTQVVVVEVPVQVIRDGEPVRGLTAADFEVFDGRDKQTLTGFEAVDLAQLGGDALATAELPSSARRHFLVLFDLTFSSAKALVQARGAALDMVEALHPTDLVAVGTWSARRGPQLVLGFTADRRQIAAALDTLGAPELLDNQAPDPLRLALVEGRDANVVTKQAETNASLARQANNALAEEILQAVSRMTEEARAVEVSVAVRDLSRSMTDFAQIMGGIQGRKHVVWLSEGFDPAVLQGGQAVGEVDDGQQASPLDGSSDRRYGGTQSLNAVEHMLEELRRADCVVQAVDIAGLRGQGDLGGRKVAGQDVLLNFAKGTGGELYEKTNDLGGAMQQMLRRTGVTYVLSFQPEKVGSPETFHRLRVEVKNQPRGTRVVHRPGWYAPKPYRARGPLEKMMSAASQLLGGEEGGPIRTAPATAALPAPGPGPAARPARTALRRPRRGTGPPSGRPAAPRGRSAICWRAPGRTAAAAPAPPRRTSAPLVYNLGTGAVRVRAKVLGADGKEVSGGRIKLLEHRAGPPDRLLASYDPPQLPPGAYHLQVTLIDGSGAARTSSTSF